MILTGETMVSCIAKAISNNIGTRVGAIYKNTPMQDAKTPYIFINSVLTSIKPQMKGYYMVEYTVDVICHPDKLCTTVESWARNLSFDLTEYLNYVDVGDYKCKCTQYRINLVDNVLHIICNYFTRACLTQQEADVLMRVLEEHRHIKE